MKHYITPTADLIALNLAENIAASCGDLHVIVTRDGDTETLFDERGGFTGSLDELIELLKNFFGGN